jgi:hypothetical protein
MSVLVLVNRKKVFSENLTFFYFFDLSNRKTYGKIVSRNILKGTCQMKTTAMTTVLLLWSEG